MPGMKFVCESRAGRAERRFAVEKLIIAGWTGRDRAKMEEHVRELEALGVRRPRSMPTFYRVAASRLTTATSIQATGDGSGGEAEIMLFNDGSQWWVGLCSDHTDRKVEAYGITVSKQMCEKPCAPVLWPFDEVADHCDELRLSSSIVENGQRVEYQQGSLAAMLAPQDLVSRYEAQNGAFEPGAAMLCGTLPAIGGVRPCTSFAMSLDDPVLGRRIEHRYEVEILPIAEG